MKQQCERQRVAVVGLGNILLTDDGVGVHALRLLEAEGGCGAELLDAGTDLLHAADALAGTDALVVIDALAAGGEPGTVYTMDGADAARRPTGTSLHALSLQTALDMLPPEERPRAWTLVGVEPLALDYGMELSNPVRRALPRVVQTVRDLLANRTLHTNEHATRVLQ